MGSKGFQTYSNNLMAETHTHTHTYIYKLWIQPLYDYSVSKEKLKFQMKSYRNKWKFLSSEIVYFAYSQAAAF